MADQLDDSKALCKDVHVDLFFPPIFSEERTAPESKYYDIGRLVCGNCTQREACDALGANEEHGMWGGRTPKERRECIPFNPSKRLDPEKLNLLPPPGDMLLPEPERRLNIPDIRSSIRKHITKA